jgi:ribokinase
MRILVFGSLNIDLIFSVDHIVRPGETIDSASLEKGAGGKGANQAAALAKAGMNTYMAGKIGRDGQFLLEYLSSYGVNTDWVALYEGNTGQAIIQLDKNKQNSIVLYQGGNGFITPDEVRLTMSQFNRGDWLALQNEITVTGFIMEEAKERGLKICLNPSPYNRQVEKLPLDLADILFVNEIEGAALASLPPETPPPAMLNRLVERFSGSEIILTAGRDGAYYGFRNIREKGNIVDLPAVDTTGAGDTFTGYYLAARVKNFSVPEALNLACKAASIAVSRKGAMESIPLGAEVF